MSKIRWIAVLALPFVACGGAHHASPTPAHVRAGKVVFATRCTACHSLAGVGPSHPTGDDLGGYHMSANEVLLRARSMPPAAKMTERDLRTVAIYVASEQARGRGARH